MKWDPLDGCTGTVMNVRTFARWIYWGSGKQMIDWQEQNNDDNSSNCNNSTIPTKAWLSLNELTKSDQRILIASKDHLDGCTGTIMNNMPVINLDWFVLTFARGIYWGSRKTTIDLQVV